VLGEGCDDGILVDSQGATYARYASFAPGARELLELHDQQFEHEQIAASQQNFGGMGMSM